MRHNIKLKKSIILFDYIIIYFGYWINKTDFWNTSKKYHHIIWFEFRIGRFAIDIEFNTNRKYYFHFYPFYK